MDRVRIIKEWLELWENSFKHDEISDDQKFWYPIHIIIMFNETMKAQMVQISCYDKNSAEEMCKGEYFTHSLGGESCTCQMWLPKKIIDFENKKAPYGMIKKNLEKLLSSR